jgi:uroporphyrinogen decarboxylase
MNSRERIVATLTGAPLDRRAFIPGLSLYGARLTGCPLDRYYSDPIAYVAGQTAVREAFAPDVLFAPFVFAKIAAAFGCQIRAVSESAPNVRRGAISSVAELDQLRVPDLDTSPELVYFCEAVRRLVAEHGSTVPVAVALPSPTDLPALILGMDTWMETVLFDRDSAWRVIELIGPFIVRFVNRMFELGADFAVMPCAFGSPALVTREIAEMFSKPVIVDALAQFAGPVIFHHGGAPLLPFLDLFVNLPNTVGVVIDHLDNLAQSRAILGPDLTLLGGVFGPGLASLSAAEIEALCQNILADRQSDSHFILCTSGPDIPYHTPPENIMALRTAVEKPV